MQRKLDVAMGLVHRPRVLFLDEPTTGLDPEARAELWDEIGRLARDDGLTILLTTHYLEEADRLAGRLAIVDHGRIVAEGTPDALKAELHGDAIHIELAAVADGGPAAAVRAVAHRRPRRRRASTGPGLGAVPTTPPRRVPAVLSALDAAGVGVATVTVARPSLDDVYLRHTGRAYPPGRPRRSPDDRPRPDRYMTGRHLRAFLRQPWFVGIGLIQPVIWLLLFGALF